MKTKFWQFDSYAKPSQALRWREQELPQPGSGQALVKLKAIGLNSSDQRNVEGDYFPDNQFPRCVGTEAVGEIVALGPRSDDESSLVYDLDLNVGARVALLCVRIDSKNMGVCREYAIYDQAALAPVPESYSDAEGAALWMGVITMAGALLMGNFSASNGQGKKVLVTAGASGMGVIALKLAKAWGATTIATTRSADKVADLQALADKVILCDDSQSLSDGVAKATDNGGVDVALDPIGAAYFPGILQSCASGAHVVSYEAITGSDVILPIFDLLLKDISLHGYTVFRPMQNPSLLNQLVNIGMQNAEALRPIIADTYELSQLPEALEAIERCEHIGKLIIQL